MSLRNTNVINHTTITYNGYPSQIWMDVSKDPIICKWWEGRKEYNRKRNFPIIEKGHVRNCHHFASVLVCKLSTFPSSSPKHIGILELNLTMMYIGWLCSLLITRNSAWLACQWCVLIYQKCSEKTNGDIRDIRLLYCRNCHWMVQH